MALSIYSSIPAIHPARNPLRIVIQESALPPNTPADIELLLESESAYGEADWKVVAEYLNPFDRSNGLASVVINRGLLGLMKQIPPDPGSTAVQALDEAVVRYRFRYRLILDGIPSGSYITSSVFHSWLAGSDYLENGIDLTGKAYLFLSTKPDTRSFCNEEKLLLCFLPLVSGSATLNSLIHFTDGTTQADDISLGSMTVYRPQSIYYELPSVTKEIDFVEFSLSGLTGTAEKLTYKLISRQFNGQLIYANSYGGFDSLSLTGKNEVNHTEEGDFFEGQLLDPLPFQQGNFEAINQSSYDGLLLRSGYTNLKERTAIKDCMLRNQAYILEDGKLVKLILENDSHLQEKDGDFLYSLTISARKAFSNLAYSRK